MTAKISGDVTGIPASDGKTVHAPLKGKSAKEVFEAHNKPGTQTEHLCKCAHCEEHKLTAAE